MELTTKVREFLDGECDAGVKRCLAIVYHKDEKGQYQMKYDGKMHCTQREYPCPLKQAEGARYLCNVNDLRRDMR